MKFKKFLQFLIFLAIITLSANNFNIYADNYNNKSNYKLAMEPNPRPMEKRPRSTPYSYDLVVKWILNEAQKADLEFSKPDENFTINKFYCFYQGPSYYKSYGNQNNIYYIASKKRVYYYNNAELHPTYVDYKNKIALIIQDEDTWYDYNSPISLSIFSAKIQAIENFCIFNKYTSEDGYRVILFPNNNFFKKIKIEDVQQSIANLLNFTKNYRADCEYSNKTEKIKEYTYEEAYEYIHDSQYKESSPFKSNGALEINNCFAVFYDKSYFTYRFKMATYDLYTTRYYLKNVNIVPDFVDEKNKVAVLLYDKDDWDNEENANTDYFINNIKSDLTEVLKTEAEYKDYLNNDEYYLIVLNKENFLESDGGIIPCKPPSLYEISVVFDQYRNKN